MLPKDFQIAIENVASLNGCLREYMCCTTSTYPTRSLWKKDADDMDFDTLNKVIDLEDAEAEENSEN